MPLIPNVTQCHAEKMFKFAGSQERRYLTKDVYSYDPMAEQERSLRTLTLQNRNRGLRAVVMSRL